MTQKDIIIDYLLNHGEMTTLTAFRLGITRLASRVHELRKEGYPIEGETITRRNRYGKIVKFTRYRLVKPT